MSKDVSTGSAEWWFLILGADAGMGGSNKSEREIGDFQLLSWSFKAEVSCPVLEPGQFSLCHVQLQVKRNALISDDFNRELSFYTSHGKVSPHADEFFIELIHLRLNPWKHIHMDHGDYSAVDFSLPLLLFCGSFTDWSLVDNLHIKILNPERFIAFTKCRVLRQRARSSSYPKSLL